MDIIFFVIILILAVVIVLVGKSSPVVQTCAQIGGIGWLLWLIVQIVKYLTAH